MPDAKLDRADLDLLTDLGREAGQIAMKWFGQDPQVWMKEGQSPVSEADFAVDNFLKNELLKARPDYGWLSEETDDNDDRLRANRVFVVDPNLVRVGTNVLAVSVHQNGRRSSDLSFLASLVGNP